MTWFTDSQIAADATPGLPVKARTVNRVQQNIASAFAGEPNAPTLASPVAGFAIAGLALDAVGAQRFMTYTSPTATQLFLAGQTYSATAVNSGTNSAILVSAGTWLCLGGGMTAAASPFYFAYQFVRIA